MLVSEQLKHAIERSRQTHYRIAKETGVDTRTLDRFMSGEQASIQSTKVDALCEYFGLELRPKKRRTGRKQARKKR